MVGMRVNFRPGMSIPRKDAKNLPKFVRRYRFDTTGAQGQQNFVVPVDKGGGQFCIARGIGSGGYFSGSTSNYANTPAGGGEYKYEGFITTPGETLILKVSPTSNNGPFATQVLRGSKVLFNAAAGGNVTTNGVPGLGGTSAKLDPNGIAIAGTGGSGLKGGSQTGDVNQDDSLNLWGIGADGNVATSANAQGFGGGAVITTGGFIRRHTGGILILEFYTGDPRGVSL